MYCINDFHISYYSSDTMVHLQTCFEEIYQLIYKQIHLQNPQVNRLYVGYKHKEKSSSNYLS